MAKEHLIPPGLRDAIDTLDARAPAMIETVEAWSRINSGSYEPAGLARMAEVLEGRLGALPGVVSRVPLAATSRVRADGALEPIEHGAALRLVVRPEARVKVALTGHFDTVFPSTSAFQAPRRVDADTLNGPGVADMKGGIVVMLEALAAFERTPAAAAIGYEVLLSPDEEIGSPASAALLAELGGRANVGMVYEPALADGSIVNARKGSGNFALALKGRAAHVGRAFADGRSAIAAAADATLRLEALNGRRDGVTFNVGAIDGGGPTNMVPPAAVVRFNVRAPDAAAAAWAQGEIAAIVAAAEARDGIAAQLHGGFGRPPKPLTTAQSALMGWASAAAGDLGMTLAFQASGGVCEGNNLAAAGCPNLDTLGPCGGALHSPEEFARISSFPERAKLSLMLLHGLADGRFDLRELAA